MSRHAEILETAARLFREHGFHGVGVDEIGKQVGISGPALYRHFSSKDEILATLLNEAMDKIAVETQGIFDEPRDELDFLVRHHAAFVVNNLELVAIYAHEHRSLVEPFRRMFTKRMREHAARWERFRDAWEPTPWPEQLVRAIVSRNEQEPDQVLTVSFFDVPPSELELLRDEPELLNAEDRRLARIAEFEEAIVFKGI